MTQTGVMLPAAWPVWLDALWAKSVPKGKRTQPAETLATHTWHVLARLADFARLRPGLPAQALFQRGE